VIVDEVLDNLHGGEHQLFLEMSPHHLNSCKK
jgi:hypothetical protein